MKNDEMIYEEMTTEELNAELGALADHFKSRNMTPVKGLMILSCMIENINKSGIHIVSTGTRPCNDPDCASCKKDIPHFPAGPVGHA
jgi:hypothetical protein